MYYMLVNDLLFTIKIYSSVNNEIVAYSLCSSIMELENHKEFWLEILDIQ